MLMNRLQNAGMTHPAQGPFPALPNFPKKK